MCTPVRSTSRACGAWVRIELPELKNWKFPGIFTEGNKLLTKNLAPSIQVYGEELIEHEGEEYRAWNPKRSKAAAMLRKGISLFPIGEDSRVLYLGAANGTTASHLSDIAYKGAVFCVEFSKRAFHDLASVCQERKNMIPILADARKPESYRAIVGSVDVVYQDIAQRDQTRIFLLNMEQFLRNEGFGILMVKARSIDVAAKPKDIFEGAQSELEDAGYEVLENKPLSPFEKDHAAIIVKKITK